MVRSALAQELQKDCEMIAKLKQEQKQKKKERTPAAERRRVTAVRAVDGGKSTLHRNSARNKVLTEIEKAGDEFVTVAELEERLLLKVRGHIQKLLESGHLEIQK